MTRARATEASLRMVSDVAPNGRLTQPVRDRTHSAFPALLSQSWGEAAWTATDLWMTVPVLAALRASSALSGVSLPIDLEVQQRRTYRRLRQSAEELRARTESGVEAHSESEYEPSPTDAMAALGGRVASWSVRLVVLAFLLAAIALGFELGVTEAIRLP